MTAVETPRTLHALEADAHRAFQERDFAAAAALLRQATALAPDRLPLWLSLAAAHRAGGELEPALAAVETALRLEPRDFAALLMHASLVERLRGPKAAAPVYGAALLQAPPEAELNEATRRTLARAREVNSRYGAGMNAALRASVEGLPLSREGQRRAEVLIDRLTGRRAVYVQQPLGYCYPGLPAIEFWDRAHFPWLEALEAASGAIAEETASIGADDPALVPYMDLPQGRPVDQWAELNRSLSWSAFHLYKHGQRHEANCARCPQTLAALANVPQPQAPDRSPSAMVSVLKPGARIPPHTGVSNTRLVGHLALSVPERCGLRVGAETRGWRAGEAFVFDDTIEHEAWNLSDTSRAVLIFDVRHPLIPNEEQAAIAAVMGAMDAFTWSASDAGL